METRRRAEMLQEGLWTGLIGYLVVALVMGLIDVARGLSFFFTAAVLGAALFGTGGEVAVTPELVFPYNGVHLLVFLGLGLLLAFLVYEIELHLAIWYLVFFLVLGLFFLSLFVVNALGETGGPGVSWLAVFVANSLAAVAMGAYLHRRHRELWLAIRDRSDSEIGPGTAPD